MYRNLLLSVALSIVIVGCKGRGQEEMAASFPIVTPPAMMNDAQDRADYMALHFWDAFMELPATINADTSLIGGVRSKEVEQKFADWAAYLGMVDFRTAVKSVENLYRKASLKQTRDTSSNVFRPLSSLVQKYLFDPNSPFRNEDLYGTYASLLSTSPLVDKASQGIYSLDARICSKNRIGTKAADFKFSDKNGKLYSLYDIKASFTLLFFSNPGCHACMDIIEGIKSSQMIDYMITTGELAVLNIYIDEDIQAWRSYMSVYPDNWYNGFDPNYIIRTELLYNVRAIPSLYLLDAEKVVLMKDAPAENIFSYLNAKIQQGL